MGWYSLLHGTMNLNVYNNKSMLYKYKKKAVNVPPLQMVDDIISASKCENKVVETNSVVKTFVKIKKL